MCPTFLSDLTKISIFPTDFHKSPPPQHLISRKLVQQEPSRYTWPDRGAIKHDEANSPFRQYVNAPKYEI